MFWRRVETIFCNHTFIPYPTYRLLFLSTADIRQENEFNTIPVCHYLVMLNYVGTELHFSQTKISKSQGNDYHT